MNMKRLGIWGLMGIMILFFFGNAEAARIFISDDIVTSATWTVDNWYSLTDQVYVLPGATLTIEAGTVIASTAELGGSLAVTRGAKIYINGTKDNPVIMTSTDDLATWEDDPDHPTGKNPKTGSWRMGVNEWGNLTIMGRGLISASHYDGEPVSVQIDEDGIAGGTVNSVTNTKQPTGMNMKQMEGLTGGFPGDPKVLYGGADDNDDSGSISYLSLRYGGKVIALQNELNGLSLGAIGRNTDISHVEIMNNVDDGIEIWGGTVNLKYVSIWNIGDDSFDVDEGWRGKAQFGLIVQGYSTDAKQGSGFGDNCFETDGAEDSDAQPVTTSTIYNFTAVGEPLSGDGGTVWRDNARMQYRNCIFMDLGEKLVRPDGDDGDGANGYGYNGTLTFAETWNTDAGTHSTVNAATNASPGEFNHPDTMYTVQTSGKLAEISDSIFFRNQASNAYTDAATYNVLAATNNNEVLSATDPMPIKNLVRNETPFVNSSQGKSMLRVTRINPLPANDALRSVDAAPNEGFFIPANYRGGFAPADNWLLGWTAADAFSMVVRPVDGDIDGDGFVGSKDLLLLMNNWQKDSTN